ncbi:p-loop containing nucleoside triphosphate hydrolase protein [Diplodia corticola]|uniref:p-loop containing nucleoside triphosphate hydrolase protein n=1 Tax=Diplodia corticola TaxID=236234 RepID=A0A1J9QXF5_9PEZI|nr:p-loop containing nucleoside triphosphate hydrolase protein [Diplodia corticola]OJD32666.1 p-loop containing nucleoside triphosphate hydrolase protein [Diplodia corticola]
MTTISPREECMVLVMGVTGAGKSHFVNKEPPLSLIAYSDVGEDMSVAIVDTPGFDDTVRSDAEVLHEITRFLSTQHQLGIRLKGIIYLQSINEVRMRGSSVRYFEMFQQICGEQAFSNVILLTTMWDRVPESEGRKRQQQLREEFWNTLEDRGSTIAPFDGSAPMAEGFIMQLLAKEDVVLQVQNELDDSRCLLGQTSAGRLVLPNVKHQLEITARELDELDKEISIANSAGRQEERIRYEEKKRDTLKKMKREKRDLEELKTNVHSEAAEKIAKVKKSMWKSGFQVLATVAGLSISIFVNLLPFLGVY